MRKESSSFIKLLAKQADAKGADCAYSFLQRDRVQQSMTFGELEKSVRQMAAYLVASGLQPKDRILLFCEPSLSYIISFWACLYASTIPVPAYPPNSRNTDMLNKIATDSGAKCILSTQSIRQRFEKFSNRNSAIHSILNELQWLSIERGEAYEGVDCEMPNASGDDIAFLQYTSG